MMILALGGTAFGQSESSVTCSSDVRWLNTNANLSYSRTGQVPASLSLLVHVSTGRNCNHEVTLTATYLTETLDYICSGTMRQAMRISDPVQTFNIEVRPFMQLEFLRWRNEPGIRGLQQGRRLTCFNLDGTADVGDSDRQKATWVRLSVAVLSRDNLDVEEVTLRISP
jgi:hypothetical protein